MNLLSNLMPSVREVRAPLIGGYFWLIGAWLLVSDHVPTESESDAGSVWAALYRLDDITGAIGGIVLLSVSAYLVGSLVGALTTLLVDHINAFDSTELELAAEEFPQLRYLLDRATQLLAESDLRVFVGPPLLMIAAVAGGWLSIPLTAIAVGLLWHGAALRSEAGKRWRTMEARVELLRQETRERATGADVQIEARVGDRLRITNRGPGVARSIMVEAVSDWIVVDASMLPIAELRHGDFVEIPAERPMEQPVSFVRVTWTDGRGEQQVTRSV